MRPLCMLLLCASYALGQSSESETATLEQLLRVEVTSASKKVQPLTKVAAAMYVITQEDIRRSGATSIPDLLRWVPGIEVAQIDSNKWAITSRGFNGRFSQKILVLLDGRSLYGTDFSGVFWDVQDTVLEDIERIEVIRGAGATMWGANAVNGVINIITKHSRNTHGGLLQAHGGSYDRAGGQVRYGRAIGSSGHVRVFAKNSNRDTQRTESGAPTDSSWRMSLMGFRSDWDLGRADKVMVQGDVYQNERGTNTTAISYKPPFRTFNGRANASGGALVGRWSHSHRDLSQTAVQMSVEHHRHDDAIVVSDRETVDVSFQRQQFIAGGQDLQWGGGYRSSVFDMAGTDTLRFAPPNFRNTLFTVFVQDEVQLIEGVLSALAGSEIEHNTYTGIEYQPTARMVWTPTPRATGWAAISRAVRTPSQTDRGLRLRPAVFPGAGGQLMGIGINGSEEFISETMRSHELGWRSEWSKKASTDVSVFYNIYSHLKTAEPELPSLEPGPTPVVVLSNRFANLAAGEGNGLELSNRFQLAAAWRLTTGYTYLKLNLHKRGSKDPKAEAPEGQSPRHKAFIQSSWDLPHKVQLDMSVARTGKLKTVSAYTRADARIGWAASQALSFSLVGQNLIGPPHVEFDATDTGSPFRSQVSRSVYGQITWKF